jgi:hypothetical protein
VGLCWFKLFFIFRMFMVCNVLLFGCGVAVWPSPFCVFESCVVFLVVMGVFIWA